LQPQVGAGAPQDGAAQPLWQPESHFLQLLQLIKRSNSEVRQRLLQHDLLQAFSAPQVGAAPQPESHFLQPLLQCVRRQQLVLQPFLQPLSQPQLGA